MDKLPTRYAACATKKRLCACCARMLAATSTMDVATVQTLAAGDQVEVRQSQAASISRANSSGTHVFRLISALPQGSLNGNHLRGSKQYKSMVSLRDFPYYNYPVIGGEPWMMYFRTTK